MGNSNLLQPVKVNRKQTSGLKAIFRRHQRAPRMVIVVRQVVPIPLIHLISAVLIAVKDSAVNTEEKRSSVHRVQIDLTSRLAFGGAQIEDPCHVVRLFEGVAYRHHFACKSVHLD